MKRRETLVKINISKSDKLDRILVDRTSHIFRAICGHKLLVDYPVLVWKHDLA